MVLRSLSNAVVNLGVEVAILEYLTKLSVDLLVLRDYCTLRRLASILATAFSFFLGIIDNFFIVSRSFSSSCRLTPVSFW
jgi:hypothetical protein